MREGEFTPNPAEQPRQELPKAEAANMLFGLDHEIVALQSKPSITPSERNELRNKQQAARVNLMALLNGVGGELPDDIEIYSDKVL